MDVSELDGAPVARRGAESFLSGKTLVIAGFVLFIAALLVAMGVALARQQGGGFSGFGVNGVGRKKWKFQHLSL